MVRRHPTDQVPLSSACLVEICPFVEVLKADWNPSSGFPEIQKLLNMTPDACPVDPVRSRQRQHRINQTGIDEIVAAYAAGLPINELVKRFHVNEHGSEVRPTARRPSEDGASWGSANRRGSVALRLGSLDGVDRSAFRRGRDNRPSRSDKCRSQTATPWPSTEFRSVVEGPPRHTDSLLRTTTSTGRRDGSHPTSQVGRFGERRWSFPSAMRASSWRPSRRPITSPGWRGADRARASDRRAQARWKSQPQCG